MGKRLESAKKWLGFASSSRTNPEAAPAETPDWVGQAVVDFRQRIAEDPEYLGALVDGMLAQTQQQEARDAAASREQLGSEEWADWPDDIHALIGEAARSVIDALTHPPTITDGSGEVLSPQASAAREFYELMGGVIIHAYEMGLNECPPILQQAGVYGHYYDGIGTLVIRERILGIEGVIDNAIIAQNTVKNPEVLNG